MREHCGDLEARGALDIHEEAVGALYESLKLVLASFNVGVWVQEIVFQLNHQGENQTGKREGVEETQGLGIRTTMVCDKKRRPNFRRSSQIPTTTNSIAK